MASTTGIELKPESCVVVGVRASRAVTSVFALHLMEPPTSPTHDAAIAATLRAARDRDRLPRRARVVLWGVSDPVSLNDPTTLLALQPFTAAGFRIEAVLSPAQALAALAATRPRDAGSGAVAWLAINMNGAAIAIVRGTDLLFARAFDWQYAPGIAGSRAELLQRYTLVAHLAPELRHGIAKVQSVYGLTVDTAVTCGDLPDLRSLTMPLIEELDLEVETLDSTDGLLATGRARERVAESAPAIRLACAAGVERSRPGTWYRSFALAAATVLVAVAGIGYVYWSAPAPLVNQRSVLPASARYASGRSSTPEPPVRPAALNSVAQSEPPAGVPKTPPPGQPEPPARPDVPPAGTTRAPSPPQPSEVLTHAGSRASSPRQGRSGAPGVPGERGRGVGATGIKIGRPLPKVDSILIDRDRRLAIIDGAIHAVGDDVGTRIVVRIDREAVILREPSGVEVRVPLRSATPR